MTTPSSICMYTLLPYTTVVRAPDRVHPFRFPDGDRQYPDAADRLFRRWRGRQPFRDQRHRGCRRHADHHLARPRAHHDELRADLRALRGDRAHLIPVFLAGRRTRRRSEEHTSELQSLMRISYAVFCLKKKTNKLEDKIFTIQRQTYETKH